VLRSRKLAVGGVAAASALAVFGIAALPSASAANCTVTVKLLGGTLTTLSVPQGVSLSTLSLPAGAVIEYLDGDDFDLDFAHEDRDDHYQEEADFHDAEVGRSSEHTEDLDPSADAFAYAEEVVP